MGAIADLTAIQPVPYLPLVRPLPKWARVPVRTVGGMRIHASPMLYVPGILKSMDGRWLARSIWPLVNALHLRKPIDFIDAHFGYPEGVGCVQVAQKLGVPAFITLRGVEQEYVRKAGVGTQMIAALRTAAGCIAVSYSLRQAMIQHGVRNDRICVIHNAIDSARFRPGDKAAARARLGLDPHSRIIASVGNLVSGKGHHVLIAAFAQIRRNFPESILAIIGGETHEKGYLERIRNLARELGVANSVVFAGNMTADGVVTWLQAADVFALATAREGCCNAVLEALAVGVPVVTTSVGDNSCFVQNGRNGFLIEVGDETGLACAIRDALLDTSWNTPKIAAALVAQIGDWHGVAQRVLAFMTERRNAIASAGPAASLRPGEESA